MSVPTSLTKQLLQLHHPDQKISNEAVELSSEFLKLLIQEARRRAAIEVCLWCYYFVLPDMLFLWCECAISITYYLYLIMYCLFILHPNMNIHQAECEAETEIIDPKSKTKSGDSSLSDLDDLSMDDDGSSSSKQKDGKSTTVEIRADHVAKIAAELMLDLS